MPNHTPETHFTEQKMKMFPAIIKCYCHNIIAPILTPFNSFSDIKNLHSAGLSSNKHLCLVKNNCRDIYPLYATILNVLITIRESGE